MAPRSAVCCSESTCSSSESESSPKRPVVPKEEQFVKKSVDKTGRNSTESHGNRSKHRKKHKKHKPKLKLSHHQYKQKAKRSRKHKYQYQSRSESLEGEPAVKKRNNEHKQTKSKQPLQVALLVKIEL